MTGFLDGKLGEISQRARTSQKIYKFLEDNLEKFGDNSGYAIGRFNDEWSFSTYRQDSRSYYTDHGLIIYDPFEVNFHRRLDLADPNSDMLCAFQIVISRDTAVIGSGTITDKDGPVYVIYKELSPSELSGLLEDMARLQFDPPEQS